MSGLKSADVDRRAGKCRDPERPRSARGVDHCSDTLLRNLLLLPSENEPRSEDRVDRFRARAVTLDDDEFQTAERFAPRRRRFEELRPLSCPAVDEISLSWMAAGIMRLLASNANDWMQWIRISLSLAVMDGRTAGTHPAGTLVRGATIQRTPVQAAHPKASNSWRITTIQGNGGSPKTVFTEPLL